MTKLTRYTNFEDLKSNVKPRKTDSIRNKKMLSEFEDFINLLKRKYSVKKGQNHPMGNNN